MTGAGAASAEQVEAAWEDNKLAQVLYHDWEAQTYDEKWSISFDDRCTSVVRDRFLHVLESTRQPGESLPFGRTLELGAGTGFFSLNLKLAGLVDEVHVSDLSPGMVEAAKANARRLGFEIEGQVADAEALPYEDDSFDLVVGHAQGGGDGALHHAGLGQRQLGAAGADAEGKGHDRCAPVVGSLPRPDGDVRRL